MISLNMSSLVRSMYVWLRSFDLIFQNVRLTKLSFLHRMVFLSPARCLGMLCLTNRTKLLLSARPW